MLGFCETGSALVCSGGCQGTWSKARPSPQMPSTHWVAPVSEGPPLSFLSLWSMVSWLTAVIRFHRGSREGAVLGGPQLPRPLATSLVQSGLCCCLSFEAGVPETCSGQVSPAFLWLRAWRLEGGHGCCLCSRCVWVLGLSWEWVPAVWLLRWWGNFRALPLRPSLS